MSNEELVLFLVGIGCSMTFAAIKMSARVPRPLGRGGSAASI